MSGTAAAHHRKCDVVVDPDSSQGDADTIQDGVDAAESGDTVCVTDGTYTEQVVINKDLTLKSARDANPTIVAPGSPTQYEIPESGATWEPIVFAFGGTLNGGSVTGSGTISVSISGFTIDGDGRNPTADRSVGILYRNVAGHAKISHNRIQNMGFGAGQKQTFGIVVYGDSHVKICKNHVREYERGGIGANGDGGDHPAPKVYICKNTVIGAGDLEESWAPNGIQIGFGAKGTIKKNTVRDNRWSPTEGVSSGILVFESDGVHVKKNCVINNDIGVASGAWALLNDSADRTKIVHNDIDDTNVGVLLQAAAIDGTSTSDPSVSKNIVAKNCISDPNTEDDDVGVWIDAFDNDDQYDPILQRNKVIKNLICGYSDGVIDDGTDTVIFGNRYSESCDHASHEASSTADSETARASTDGTVTRTRPIEP